MCSGLMCGQKTTLSRTVGDCTTVWISLRPNKAFCETIKLESTLLTHSCLAVSILCPQSGGRSNGGCPNFSAECHNRSPCQRKEFVLSELQKKNLQLQVTCFQCDSMNNTTDFAQMNNGSSLQISKVSVKSPNSKITLPMSHPKS